MSLIKPSSLEIVALHLLHNDWFEIKMHVYNCVYQAYLLVLNLPYPYLRSVYTTILLGIDGSYLAVYKVHVY